MAEDSATSSNCISKREVCNDQYYESWSATQIQVVKFRHTWSIHNFSFCVEETGGLLSSATFSSGINSDATEWYLMLYPKGENKEYSNWVSLYFKLINCKLNEIIKAKVKMGYVDANGEDVIRTTDTLRFEKNCYTWAYNKFIKRDYVYNEENKVLLDGKFTIFCEITAAVGRENLSGILPPLAKGKHDLGKDLSFLLKNSEFSDVTLCAGGKEFKAHKLILSARSPVFRAMFQLNTKEAINNQISITDIDEDGMCEMLRFIYTGIINKLKEMAPKLLGVAERYAITGLKMTCEEVLIKSISVDNAADIFILSDTFNATKLKIKVKNFIAAHTSEVGNTSGFQSMIRTHPHLGIEAFCAIRSNSNTNK